jgi:hypothetical protein
MATRNTTAVALDPGDLNDLDGTILDYLREEGRASPTLFRRGEGVDTSRQWVSSRFVRLAEHDHIRELHDTGIYEFVSDPREDKTDDL